MGPVTFGVTLPRPWVTRQELTAGTSLKLRWVADDAIVLSPLRSSSQGSNRPIEVGPAEGGEALFRRLVAAYVRGVELISVRSPSRLRPSFRSTVQEFLQRTVQTTIVEESERQLTVGDVAQGEALPVARTVRRMGELTIDLHERAHAVLKSPLAVSEPPWERLDQDVDRYAWFVERRIAQAWRAGAAAPDGSVDPLGDLLMARALERAADHAVQLGLHAGRLGAREPNGSLRALFLRHHRQTIDLLQRCLSIWAEPNPRAANDAIDHGEALRRGSSAVRERLFLEADRIVPSGLWALILESIDRTIAYATDIAEVALDRTTGPDPRPIRPASPPRAAITVRNLARQRR